MAFFDKVNQVAKNLGDKTGDAIETTRLNGRIRAERAAAAEELQKLGEYYYGLYEAGGEVAPETLAFCESARAHLAAAAQAQAEIDRIKAENEPPQPKGRFCPSCGCSLAPGVKFCSECGYRMEG